ncbi:MAG TPA: CHAT domain-containing protein [Longimicrobium sp.]|nr:CHAT domain-containing protein [Longimicrobium sp.]
MTDIASRAVQKGEDPGAIWTLALVDLIGDASGKSLQRSITSLGMAAHAVDRPAPVLADLAAAHLQRASRAGTPRDLLAAIEAAEAALQHEPRHPGALFNHALAMQRLGLVEEAADGWRRYLDADSASRWAGWAREGLRAAQAVREPVLPGKDAPPAAYAEYARSDPQRARELGWRGELAAWAGAALTGDTAGARRHLERAEALGKALELRAGGDATLADAVRAIRRSSGKAAATARLARAHGAFADGCALDDRGEVGRAAERFAAAAAGADGSPSLREWARLRYGRALFHAGDKRAGKDIARQAIAAADTVRHPALAGYARIQLAVMLIRGDGYVAGLAEALRGAELAARAGEREIEAVALDAASVAQFHLRDTGQGYALGYRALQRLLPYRGSYRLHNLLSYGAEMFSDDGFRRASVRVQDEGVRVASRAGPVYEVEARLTRARLRLAAGAPARTVLEDLAVAGRILPTLPDTAARRWMETQRQMVQGAMAASTQPGRAGAILDSAATFLLEQDAPMLALAAVVSGADAHLRAGDTRGGMDRLERALAILERRRDSVRMEPRRAAVFETARAVVDRATLLMLATAGPGQALAYLDRGRASLAPAGWTPPAAGGAIAGPPGEVGLEYGLVGDTLLVWTVAGRRVELFRTVVDTAALTRTVAATLRRLEGDAREADLRPDLARLYDLLVRPVEGRLGATGTPLVVVADGEVASVPFAALFDARRGRYLVQGHPLRFAASLRAAWRPTRQAGGARPALFVADPAFDPVAHPDFERLPEAAGEAAEIAARYPDGRVLRAERADPVALRAALGRAGVLHYAGHAVFDDERPEQSYLLLARTAGSRGGETLRAGEIAQLDLRNLSLVVLAACRTVRTGNGRAAGFSGLAGAFLAAGAGGTVGSLWEVDDHYTRRLMVPFHDAYRASGNGPAALQAAQLQLLRSRDPRLRSPAAWAGFRYAGR